MDRVRTDEQDPLPWCIVIALAFLALAWHRLGIPTRIYFDEVHYIRAARKLLEMTRANAEHPMVGKELIAGAMVFLGDKPLFWRVPSIILGTAGLFAFGRLMWLASGRRFATIAAMILLFTSFAWFIQSRIAMLDMIMAGFGMLALWQFAAALRLSGGKARWRLAVSGIFLALAIGTKWSFAPAAMLPGLFVMVVRLKEHGLRFLLARDSRILPGISLVEAGIWLGVLPLALYWATFAPAFLYPVRAVDPFAPIAFHEDMIRLQDSVRKPHPYRSVWYQWMINWRAVWYLYEHIDGARRGVLLIGNPFSMLAGLVAVPWCLWAAVRGRVDALAFAMLYLFSIGLWIVSEKPIQFYYHYLLPGTFLMGCLALALDVLWRRGGKAKWIAAGSLAVAVAMFAWFYPIISAAPLSGGPRSYEFWMWLRSWR
ncbi:dolichyl-phosphate-mannose--protein mannosyltransferase [Novosphingobium marinum]|uniref:Polyprenol-phosphate-mannose--protein mannosyltransferase n=1 Tax=Novosphingobium marinum TaxID=1514948 RepID=A0A7Z0BWK8_9SPHN|nr:phospholipid carrier-dependent glycosyltransferase [Novosphingobium marinum]NYH96500.1 dolichyl-phosphate-mannose--protein O-mannosyl transferase [Novosphingobium marinum]GGC35715.1 dolichyl-phosphate-mannose--protein mannosyltransferase [Novosphingobium marinum]